MKNTSKPVLVLDGAFMPVNVVPAKRALSYIVREKAVLVEPGNSNVTISSEKETWSVPSIIRLPGFIGQSAYSKVRVRFNKRTLLERDHYECQYCSKALTKDTATIDHVIPKSKKYNGESRWDNCVIACRECNHTKANRTPKEANMPLRKQPKYPHYITHLSHVLERHMKDNSEWKQYFIL